MDRDASDQKRTTYGIIGHPVTHSRSPGMHNAAFRELGVDAVYTLFPVPPEEFSSFIRGLRAKDCAIFGLNVTVPYKERVIEELDGLSPFAQKARAVNTVVVSGEDRKLIGHNTDGPGFLAHLAELSVDAAGKRVAILGAGGTTRAILAALCLQPAPPEGIRIYNRTASRARDLVADLGLRMDTGRVEVAETLEDLNIELADILINTTPVGMRPSDRCPVEEDALHGGLFVYDVVYSPPETELLRRARARGAAAANGLGMLFYQGVLSLQHWAGAPLDSQVKIKMRQSLEQETS